MNGGFRKVVFFVLIISVAAAGYQYMIKPANKHLYETKERVQAKLDKLEEFEKTINIKLSNSIIF